MTHLDRDTLALLALAELDLSAAERDHLADCPECAGELDALRRTVLIGRSAGSVDLAEPADAVWGRIHSALGLSDAVAAPPRPADFEAEDAPADAAAAEKPGDVPAAPVTELAPRRRRRWLPVAAAACAVGLVGGLIGGVWWQSTREPAAAPVLYEAELDPLPGWTGGGRAYVEQLDDGRRDVVVDVDATGADTGLREVWLLTDDATGLVSVGLLDGESGRFAIPADLDLSRYPLLDVSAEPDDGDPTHSGDSIVRGALQAF